MRLTQLDQKAWAKIGRELDELANKIAYDPYPLLPVEECPEPSPDEWPRGSLAVEAYEAIQRASVLALFAAGLGPSWPTAKAAEMLRQGGGSE